MNDLKGFEGFLAKRLKKQNKAFEDMDKKVEDDTEQAVLTIGRSVGRPKGSKCRTSKAIRIRGKAVALHEQGLSGAAIAERLGVCRNTVLQALHMDEPMQDDSRQILAFIRNQLRLMQSVVHDNGGDISRYADAFTLLDRMEQRM